MHEALTAFAARLLFGPLLRREPPLALDAAKRAAFESRAARVLSGEGPILEWDLAYPKHEFTRYLVAHHPVLLHGTPRTGVERLEPAEQTLFDGTSATAVFASDDGIWPIFFATIDRGQYSGPYSLRNAAMVAGRGGRGAAPLPVLDEPRTAGCRRLVRGRCPHPATGDVPADGVGGGALSGVSDVAVTPLGRLEVGPEDFPFHGRISAHRLREWLPLTWLLYRWRTR